MAEVLTIVADSRLRLISIYPTITFLSWNRALKAGTTPEVPEPRARQVRLCLMLELAAIVVILACAPLMARGFGYSH